MDKEQQKFLALRLKESLAEQPKLGKLRDKLLSFGGVEIVACYEEDVDKLLARGKEFSVIDLEVMEGKPCSCHFNSARLWQKNKRLAKIVTGWKLNDKDELWRQHTWCVYKKEKSIVETTVVGSRYFGFALTSKEADKFYFNNAM